MNCKNEYKQDNKLNLRINEIRKSFFFKLSFKSLSPHAQLVSKVLSNLTKMYGKWHKQ